MKTMKVKKYTDVPKNYTGIVEYPNGVKEWYLNGKLHREDGPAIEFFDREKHWFLNGKRHRIDGPAVECSNGAKHWFLNDKILDEQKIDQFVVELDYPIETVIKLVYFLQTNKL